MTVSEEHAPANIKSNIMAISGGSEVCGFFTAYSKQSNRVFREEKYSTILTKRAAEKKGRSFPHPFHFWFTRLWVYGTMALIISLPVHWQSRISISDNRRTMRICILCFAVRA
jgi:hypothetical protein